ncbi:AI-2E family transporter [Parapusillimonas granuli]|uniref:AI-2E family transporter n=1 Tax=Parapusillimonas granuli TaxID=380911 RepID=A0A853FX94_9BURK|nr:AI-2E family transporter [Parapusillimonas granuli]MBB5213463.1 putative PurR-regulated permease PerM [Parapusillimonas granuli]MEB2398556.1 AI-2E family transporter [Alcaligenaceae bacterium]NYT48302.1 AI-2E family transporter [Parapusillimonas granuli]
MDTAKNSNPIEQAGSAAPAQAEAAAVPARRPGDTALTILAVLAFVFALQWARDFFIPLVFGILIAYTLNPVVIWLERLRLPRALASAVVMLALLGSSTLVASSVYNEAQAIMDELPIATYKLTSALRRLDDGEQGPLDKLRSAADALKKAANADGGSADPAPSVQPPPAVLIKQPDFDLNDWLLAGSKSAAAFIGQLTMVLFLVFFALVSGNTFKRKLVKLTGPSLSNKKITVQILDDINSSIQKYMLMLLVTNTMLGLLTWLALHWIGLDNAGAWALVAALTHIIPYFGSMIAMTAIAFAAFLQFESFSMMLLAAFATLAISTLVGMLVSTWMTGRIAKMNAMAVFVALLFGAWLWGVWGMLLCVPVIVVIKVISQHVEDLHALAELLSE